MISIMLNYQIVLIGLSAVSSVLCDGPQNSDHDTSISDPSDIREDLGYEPSTVVKLSLSYLTTANSTSTPAGPLPVFLKFFDDLDDEHSTSLFTPRLTATQKPSSTSTSLADLDYQFDELWWQESSTTTITDPAKAALDWLNSGLDDKSATAAKITDSKHSSVVSSILSGLEATHTSAAAADRLRVGFW
ncbi:hypothetical protein Q7P35_001448 [Cladosporium inversicolor]